MYICKQIFLYLTSYFISVNVAGNIIFLGLLLKSHIFILLLKFIQLWLLGTLRMYCWFAGHFVFNVTVIWHYFETNFLLISFLLCLLTDRKYVLFSVNFILGTPDLHMFNRGVHFLCWCSALMPDSVQLKWRGIISGVTEAGTWACGSFSSVLCYPGLRHFTEDGFPDKGNVASLSYYFKYPWCMQF